MVVFVVYIGLVVVGVFYIGVVVVRIVVVGIRVVGVVFAMLDGMVIFNAVVGFASMVTIDIMVMLLLLLLAILTFSSVLFGKLITHIKANIRIFTKILGARTRETNARAPGNACTESRFEVEERIGLGSCCCGCQICWRWFGGYGSG